MKTVFAHTVRSTEVDLIGHVHHAKYLEYMEWARNDLMEEACGFTLEEMMNRNTLPVIVNVNINYRKELKLGERVKVISWLTRAGQKSFTMRQEVWTEDDICSCEADVTMVMIDGETRRSIELPAEIRAAFEA
ncbi:UNVERIFIED_CONTAM: thioesterase-3 [Brevibacillus sp. OAP136]